MNGARLEYEMKIRKVSVSEICEAIGISRSAFYRKKSGKSQFTQGEIAAVVKYLHLETPMGIFFDAEVS